MTNCAECGVELTGFRTWFRECRPCEEKLRLEKLCRTCKGSGKSSFDSPRPPHRKMDCKTCDGSGLHCKEAA